MSDSEFRDEIKAVIKRHELGADDLRDLAADLETLADRWDDTEDVL